MNICSLAFLACVSVVVIVYHLFAHARERQLFLTTVNYLFLSSLVPNVQSWLCLLFFIGVTYAMLSSMRARPSYNSVLVFVGLIVVVFLYLKGYLDMNEILPADFQLGPVAVIGLSYMLFKFIHMLVDLSQGQLAAFSFLSYANYQLSFFTLLAGPIQRFNDFQRSWEDMDAQPADTRETLQSWSRLLTGLLKMGVLAPLVEQLVVGQDAKSDVLQRFAIQFYGFPVYLYLNFSGYTDVVIGCGRLLGFQLPENFNCPYLARNAIDFWNRWHMTLTHWIRDYIFMTSYKRVAETVPAWSKPLGYVLLFFSLFVAGVWHGVTVSFAVFGIIHGLGVALNQAYTDALKAWLGRAGLQRYQKNCCIHLLAVVVTFHFVCFSFLFFALDVRGAWELLEAALGQLMALASTVEVHWFYRASLIEAGLVLLLAVLRWRRPASGGRKPPDGPSGGLRPPLAGRWLYALVFAKTALVVLLFTAMWLSQQKDPVLVYMRF